MAAPPRGNVIFWAGVLAFVLFDLAAVVGGALVESLPLRAAAPVLAYVLLAAFALSLAVVSGVVLTAVRTRSAPAPGDALRALVALALVVVHAALVVARQRGA
jgi:hypothetical protein